MERERENEWGKGGERDRKVRRASEQERRGKKKKKSLAEKKDYIGDFGFRVSSGPKPIFPIFRLPESHHSN